MTHRTMRDPMDDIARQAHQGSVAAIIQTLNEKLADAGVRTRAVFADGVLQLLCEAATKEQLDQPILIAKIRQILEDIAPLNIRRVKINSRIVREQQLLWLEEINRDPENQLLWSEEIILAKPNLFKRLAESVKNYQTATKTPVLPSVSSLNQRGKSSYRRGIASGIGLTVILMFISWLLYTWLSPRLKIQISAQVPNSTAGTALKPTSMPKSGSSSTSDPFVQAVRLAEQASVTGQTVKTSAQWLDLAAKWQQASDLMGTVKPDDSRYKTAQDRMKVYRQNSDAAQQQARKNNS